MSKLSPKEIERRLGLQYAQYLKENPQTADIYKDCREVIQASLTVMDHYNRIAVALQRKMPARQAVAVRS